LYAKLPGPSGPVEWAPDLPQRLVLSNGLPVYYVKQGGTPLVALTLVMPRGSAMDPAGKAGLTALTMDLLDEGASGRDALELAAELERLATDLHAQVEVDHALLAMTLIAQNLEPSLRLLADVVRRPALNVQQFQRRREQQIARIIESTADPVYGRDLALRHALFGDGYGGKPVLGTRASVSALRHADVKRQFSNVVVPDGSAFVLVGNVSAAHVTAILEKTFGDWRGQTGASPAAPTKPLLPRTAYVLDYPGSSQSALAVARRAPGAQAADYFAALVYNRVLGGAFGSRLNLNLREDKGYTYGARSEFVRWQNAGYWGLTARVRAQVTKESTREMLREIADSCGARPIGSAEREAAVQGLLLGFPGRFEGRVETALQMSELPLHDRPLDWYARWPARVEHVTLRDINAVAGKYCDPSELVLVVAGDAQTVTPALAALEWHAVAYDPHRRVLLPESGD
jgi:zinc protease